MSAVATLKPQDNQNTPKTNKRVRISPAIKRAIHALVTGECKTQKDAAKLAGLSQQWLCTQLSKPEIQVFYERATREIIRGAQMRAASKVLNLIDAESEHVAADTSFKVLAINGIKPSLDQQVSVAIDIKAGYVIDLSGRSGDQAQVVEHTVSTDSVSPDGGDDDR